HVGRVHSLLGATAGTGELRWTTMPGRIRSPASRTTSSNGCNSITGTHRPPSFASGASQRPQPSTRFRVQPIEELATLELLPPPVSALLLDRIDRPALRCRRGQKLVGPKVPRRRSLVDRVLH